MKFTCIKENLEHATTIAERFTGKNITLPILNNLLLEMQGNSLQITATNLEYAIQISIPGKGASGVKASVPAKIFNLLVQSIKEEKINLEESRGNLLVETETRVSRINGVPPEDFPLFPKIKKNNGFSVDGAGVKDALEKVLPAVSPSEFKPELCGVFFKVSGKTLSLAATDTFRLAEKKVSLPSKPEGESFSFILPQRVSQEMVRVFGARDEEVKISMGENQCLVESSRIKIVSRVIDGVFPEYQAIIPKSFETTAFLKTRELSEAIRAASIFSSKLQDVSLKFSGKEVEVFAANPDVGEYKNKIQAAATNSDTSVSFNYRYLADVLGVIEEEEIFFGINQGQAPSLVRNKEDASFLYVLMPIRLK